MDTQKAFTLPRLAYSLAECEALTGLSRSTLYRLQARGELKTVKIGGSRLVPARDLERLCTAAVGLKELA